jgi:hypothetical protein
VVRWVLPRFDVTGLLEVVDQDVLDLVDELSEYWREWVTDYLMGRNVNRPPTVHLDLHGLLKLAPPARAPATAPAGVRPARSDGAPAARKAA